MGEERRLVTVLFADIVGSTSFVGDHDPEVVRAALLGTFAALRTIIETHGGVVEKFIGDEVMAVFGAPVAHEDDAERAVRTAFAVRAEVAARAVRGAPQLELRIGLNTGEVVSGGDGSEFLVTGQAVNAAARIRQAAGPGEILAGDLTRALSAATVGYANAREIDARGIGRIKAWPATGLTTAVPVRPLSRAGRLVGREAELQLLLSVERGLRDGAPTHLVTVFGPTGIGKSRLAAEFADAVGTTRVRVGHCLPYGEAVAFWPLREIVYAEAGITASDTRAEALERLARAVGETGAAGTDAEAVVRRLAVLTGLSTKEEALADEPPPNLAQELRWGLRRFLEWRAGSGPLVLVVEDLHWGDPALLDALDYVAEWAEGPLLLLCTSSPELQETRPRWSVGRANAITVTLRSLDEHESRQLVDALDVTRTFAADVRGEIVDRAEGNPLFIEELVRTLADLPDLGSAADPRDVVRRALPPTLHGLIAARIDRLPSEVREAMKRAVVVGRVFSTAGLAAFGGEDPGFEALVAEAVRYDLVVETAEPAIGAGRAYRFRHSLIRDVVYQSIPKAVRWPMHDAFGRWIEAACLDRVAEHADLIAFHAERACATALELAEPRAAELGERAFALLLAGATRWRRAGMLRAALGLYERAVRLGELTGAAPAKLVEARGFGALSRFYVDGARAALDQLDEALAAARAAGPSEVLVRLASQRAFMARLESLETSGALFAEGIAAARAVGDPELLAHATLMSNAQPWMIGDLDEQRRVLNDADTLMTASGRTAERGVALAWLATNASQRGEFPAAVAYLERSEQLARASGSRFQQWAAARAAARDALVMGDRDRALALAEASLAYAKEVGARRIVALSQIRLGEVLYEAGDLARSRTVLEDALAALDPNTMSETLTEAQWKLSRTCLASRDIASARMYAEAAAAGVAKTDLYSTVTTRAALAAVRAASGDPAGAEALLRESLATADRTGYRALTADSALALGAFLVDQQRYAEARPLLERARSFYSDDLTRRRRGEIDRLLSRSAAAATV
jgi:class 3 adenylate cyclase/tetratricopeptide (TPR) repeat protein